MRSTFFQLPVIIIFLILSTTVVEANTHGLSQHRAPHKSYFSYLKKLSLSNSDQTKMLFDPDSAFASATHLSELNLQNVTKWKNEDELMRAFINIRDTRFIVNTRKNNFPRRSSWLFPDDGCFARAELARNNLMKWEFSEPSKVFVFGDLRVQSANSLSGSVTWWYHVAPIVKVGDIFYVLDPSIAPNKPMTLNEWLSSMTSDNIERLTIAVCAGPAYDPKSNCHTPINKSKEALEDQEYFLDEEWIRQIELGRSPEKVLGDSPPWNDSKSLNNECKI